MPYPVLSTADKLGPNELIYRTAGCPLGTNTASPGSAPDLARSVPEGRITRLPSSLLSQWSGSWVDEAVFALLDTHLGNPLLACGGQFSEPTLLELRGEGGGLPPLLFVALLVVAAEFPQPLLVLAPSELNELEERALR